jgi:AraC-binding-like domain
MSMVLRVGDAGAVRVAELIACQPGGASRTARQVRRLDLEVCKVDLVVRGRGVVTQDGREAVLGPGDFTLVDLSRPAHWSMSAMRLVAVVFPRALLPLRPDEVAELSAVRFPGDQGAGALVSSLARQLVRAWATGARATGPGSAVPCSTWSASLWRPGWTGPPSCRRRPGSGPCGSASTPSWRPGSATLGCRRPRSPMAALARGSPSAA